MTTSEHMPPARPLVWYMTQGYSIRGGHEAHLLHFATEMRRRGFNTRLVVLDELPREEHRFMVLLRERGIPLRGVRAPRGLRVSLLVALARPFWSAAMWMFGRRAAAGALRDYLANRVAARDLRRLLRQEQPDLIHIMGRLSDYAWPLLPASRCLLHHGTEGRRDGTWDEAEWRAFCDFARAAAKNFAPGSGVADNLRRSFGITCPIVSVFTICPDQPGEEWAAGRLPEDADRPLRFGLLARLTPEKGIRVLLDALRAYQSRHGSVDFCFIGSGVLEEDIRGYLAQYRLEGVRLQTEFSAPADVLRNLDVFVHPSVSDAMPMAVAEALMCGLPCIVTRVGGLPDLVRDGKEGLLIEPDQPEPIVHAMERFQAMPAAERARYRKRARARYEEVCIPERVGDVLEMEYRAVLGACAPVGQGTSS